MRRLCVVVLLVASVLAPSSASAAPADVRIDAIEPNRVFARSADTEVTITGDGFRDGRTGPLRHETLVQVGGSLVSSEVIDRQHLRAVVPSNLLYQPRDLQVYVLRTVGTRGVRLPYASAGPGTIHVVEARPAEVRVTAPAEVTAGQCFWVGVAIVDEAGRVTYRPRARFTLGSDDLATDDAHDGDLVFTLGGCDGEPVTSFERDENGYGPSVYARGARSARYAIEAALDDPPLSGRSEPVAVVAGTISGLVTGPGGAPAAGVEVYAVRVGGPSFGLVGKAISIGGSCITFGPGHRSPPGPRGPLPDPVAVTGDDGSYRTSPLPPGVYNVAFRSASLASEWSGGVLDQELAADHQVVDGTDTGGVDASLGEGGTISGRVSDDVGRPVADAAVIVRTAGVDAGWAVTGVDGIFRTPGLPAGTYDLVVEASSELLPAEVPPVEVVAGGHAAIDDVQLARGGAFEGRVLDGDRDVGGSVTVYSVASGSPVASGRTEAGGTFTTSPGLPAGRYRLYADPAIGERTGGWVGGGSFAGATTFEIAAAQMREVNVDVRGSASISGAVTAVVRLAPGVRLTQPASIVQVGIFDTSGSNVACAVTDSAGRFVVDGLRPGAYTVRFSDRFDEDLAPEWYPDAPDREHAETIVLGDGETRGITARLEPGGSISGRVSGGSTYVSVEKEGEEGIWFSFYDGSSTSTEPDGSYSIRGLAAGTYRVSAYVVEDGWSVGRLWHPNAVSRSSATPVVLERRQHRGGVDLDVPRTGSVSGEIAGLSARFPSGSVALEDAQTGEVVRWLSVPRNGPFVAGRVLPGRYVARFLGTGDRAPALPSEADEVTVRSGEDAGGLEIEALPGRRIAGRVTTPDGQPVSGASVTVANGGRSLRTVWTGPDGTYLTGPLRPEEYTLRVGAPDVFVDRMVAVDVGTAVDSTGVDVPLAFRP